MYIYLDRSHGPHLKQISSYTATHVQRGWVSGIQSLKKDTIYAPTPVNIPTNVIFYFKALCVLSVLAVVESKTPRGSRVLIYTDNKNTVDIFRSLCCLPAYNHLLKTAVDILLCNSFSLQVLHVPGKENVVADALSCIQFSVTLHHEPGLNPSPQLGGVSNMI